MSADTENTQTQLTALADHLSQVHNDILDEWRALAESDPTLAPSSHLTRTQFIDHIPHILRALGTRLCSWPDDNTPEQRELELEASKSHSHHRWQMGYNMRSLVRDWGHLNVCFLQQLDSYGRSHADLQMVVLPEARQIWAKLINDSIAQSTVEYHDLLQVESTTRLHDLDLILKNLQEMELLRGHDLRIATHDLKGGVTILMGTTDLIGSDRVSQAERIQMCRMLNRGVATLHQMLEELMDMARLEAAQDPRRIAPFDVGQVFTELCETSQPLAEARGLFLKADGPSKFVIEGDFIKTRRIAQNLLLNAIKYTNEGGVSVTWKEHEGDQLLLCVQDSGPGLERSATALPGKNQGEGVGLSIVKRLCELLDAKIKVESKAGIGTTFQVLFPTEIKNASA